MKTITEDLRMERYINQIKHLHGLSQAFVDLNRIKKKETVTLFVYNATSAELSIGKDAAK